MLKSFRLSHDARCCVVLSQALAPLTNLLETEERRAQRAPGSGLACFHGYYHGFKLSEGRNEAS